MDTRGLHERRTTAIIAEDEEVLRDELVAILNRLWPRLTIAADVSNGVDALSKFDLYRPDVMFLDIQMPGLTGLQVARQVSGQCHVVFLTAYDQYAVAAFEQGAVDYLLKPYDADRLGTTIARIKERLRSAPPELSQILSDWAAAARPKEYLSWIRASRGSSVDMIMVQDVCYFKAETKYTVVVTTAGEALIRRPIKELANELDPALFWRVHRSTIVNLGAIAAANRTFRGRMTLSLKSRPEKIEVSEQYEHLFRHM